MWILSYNLIHYHSNLMIILFPRSSVGKESAGNAGDPGLFLGRNDPLEKEMATHSSIFAWRIPWTEEPSRLQSMSSQKLNLLNGLV